MLKHSRWLHYKGLTRSQADFQQIVRDPILMILLLIPLLILGLMQILLPLGAHYLKLYFNFSLWQYQAVIQTMMLIMIPSMLGTVTGFLMIEDRDSGIFQLMSITPGGTKGYWWSRIMIPGVLGTIYAIVYLIAFRGMPALLPLTGIQIAVSGASIVLEGILMTQLLIRYASDKVQGMTVAKGLSLLTLFCMADFIQSPIIRWIGLLTPQYWFYKVIETGSFQIILVNLAIHWIWLTLFSRKLFHNTKYSV